MFRIIVEVTFFLFTILFFFKELNNMRKEKIKYWRKFWNYIEIIIFLFSVGTITTYFYRYVVTLQLLDKLKSNGARDFINLQYVSYLNDLFQYMFSGVTFFATIKVLKLLRFNRRIHLLADTIHNIRWDLYYFAILFAFVLFAYSLAFYLIFSPQLFDFADIVYTMETLIRALVRRFQFADLYQVQRIVGPLFYFAYTCSMSYIVLNFMVTIVIDSFRKVRLDSTTKANEYEIIDFIVSRFRSVIGWQTTNRNQPVEKDTVNKGQSEKKTDNNMADLNNKLDEINSKIDSMMNERRRRNSKAEQKLTMKWYARRAYKQNPVKPL